MKLYKQLHCIMPIETPAHSILLLLRHCLSVSGEFKVALLWELLYADDLVVIAETEDYLIKRLKKWKDNVKNRGMRVNMNKTKVMISGKWQKLLQNAARWTCSVCGIGVDGCQKWIHKKCSGVKGSISKVMESFICGGCLNPVTSTGRTSVDIDVSANLELVDKFYYLGGCLQCSDAVDWAAGRASGL